MNKYRYLIYMILMLAIIKINSANPLIVLSLISGGIATYLFLNNILVKQFYFFISMLLVLTFIIKIGFGNINTTVIALLPPLIIGLMVSQILLIMISKGDSIRLSKIDILVILFIFLDALGILGDVFDFFQGTNRGEFVGSAILLILIVAFIAYVTKGKESEGQPKKS